ncbi:sulfite exporter TauE/SafE family protein [Saxibacter everestensis]|uniref:Probable membrane transporter protein n=1 Tax=Saxibacter everestensis TaxID=2909229 RepID=A0ABY8QRD6_9MICO|nr:sulfite exporter TauE/SafE family protein [Brevibacteriaceae bacterium ZFBP1038]
MTDPIVALVLLASFGLIAGIGITAVGPGGVLATVGLFLFTDLPPATVAGTAIVTHIATGSLGTFAYFRSGHLREANTRRIALILAGTALIGTPVGVLVNFVVPSKLFGILLGLFLTFIAVLTWLRHRNSSAEAQGHPRHSMSLLIGGGIAVAVASGMFGVGGPLLTVPLLVAIGTPMLPALAAAQAQSVIISGVGTVGYLSQGSIDWPLAIVVGVPELCGVLIGWKIARAVSPDQLRRVMIATLLAVVPFLAFHG